VLLLMLLFGFLVDTETLRTQLMAQATALLGEEGGKLIETMLTRADQREAGWSAAFGLIAAFIGATTVFAELKDSLDDLLAKQAPENLTLWQTIRARVLSFGIVLTLGFLLLVTLLANAVLAALSGGLTRWFGIEAVWIGRLIGAVISFAGTFVVCYAIYRLLPERKLSKTAVLIGAVASTMLFSVGRIGIGLYLGHTEAIAAFGAAGSLAVVLIWVYYSALAFFIGALVARYVEERQQGKEPPDDEASDDADLRPKESKRESREPRGNADEEELLGSVS
jgi:membrane protein